MESCAPTGVPASGGAKGSLSQKGIAYIEKDVASDPAAAEELFEKAEQPSVPVIIVENEVVVGSDNIYLESLLALVERRRPRIAVSRPLGRRR
jgi:glutaredoxin 3